jgi:hypothetical protein
MISRPSAILWNIPVGVVDLGIGAEKLLLARLVGVVPTDLVAVFLSLEERSEVQTGPHLLTGELTTVKHVSVIEFTSSSR